MQQPRLIDQKTILLELWVFSFPGMNHSKMTDYYHRLDEEMMNSAFALPWFIISSSVNGIVV